MNLTYREYVRAKTCECSMLRYESALLSVMNSQKQNWRFKLNGCIITDRSITWAEMVILMHIKQLKWRGRWLFSWIAHIKKFNHYFPTASRVRSEARLMSNHCHQSNEQSKSKYHKYSKWQRCYEYLYPFLWHRPIKKIFQGLQHWMAS